MQNLIDRYFESLGVRPHINMEVENNEAIKSMVRAGLGASILPLCAVRRSPRPPLTRPARQRQAADPPVGALVGRYGDPPQGDPGTGLGFGYPLIFDELAIHR